ncbi:MAG: ATP-binding protein [Panacagrimonas sp.]
MKLRAGSRSFEDKVTLLAAIASGVAVIVVSALLSLAAYTDFKREAVASANSHAQLVALNSGAPLAFGDPVAGAEALAVLRATPDVASAVQYDTAGKVFAEYRRASNPGPVFGPEAVGTHERQGWLVVRVPVLDREEIHGGVQLVYDLSHLRQRLWSGLLVALAATLGATLVGYWIGRGISRNLVRPIDELARTAHSVSRSKDYALRAKKLSADELGSLTDAFNEMLGQIQQQERELAVAQAAREALLDAERSARAEAERASRMKDEFVATLSHELRTPLTPILGWVAILKRTGPPDAQTAQGLEVIERNARVQTQIIDDLLDVSRIVSGKVRLDIQPVNLAEVIDAGVATVLPAADAREIRLNTVIDSGTQSIRGDAARLQQIVWNLLSNAIKFTPRGGRVEISLTRVESRVEIAVADSGAGIAPDFLPHVFERFRQADSSTTRQYGGLGLGLAIVKQLAELHGGSVAAHSAGVGQGARFTVTLPVVAVHVPDAVEPREHARPGRSGGVDDSDVSLKGLRILVVEDDHDARALIAMVLEGRGAEVLRAASAEEALVAVRSLRPQLMVSDIGMPGVDGYELMRLVRLLPADAGGTIPAIALTAFARSEDRTRALGAGYQLHLVKPIEPPELVAAVASIAGAGSASSGREGTEGS